MLDYISHTAENIFTLFLLSTEWRQDTVASNGVYWCKAGDQFCFAQIAFLHLLCNVMAPKETACTSG